MDDLEDEDELADRLDARRIAQLVLESIRDQPLEAAISAACEMVHKQWAYGENKLTVFKPAEEGTSEALRTISEAAEGFLASAVQRFVPRGQWGHLLVFEALLEIRAERLARAGLGFASSWMVERLMGALSGPGLRLLDPACGLGGTLTAADRGFERDSIWGVDINDDATSLASMRAELDGTQASFVTGDFLQGIPSDTRTLVSGQIPSEWDVIVAEPPMGTKVRLKDEGLGRHITDGDALWLEMIVRVLAPTGRAVVLLPASFGSREGDARELRIELLERNQVEAVIALPAGEVLGSSISTHMWVIAGSDRVDSRDVLLIDGAALGVNEGGKPTVVADRVAAVCNGWLDTHGVVEEAAWFARAVPVAQLLPHGDTDPSRYLRKPPKRDQPRPPSTGRLITELRLSGFKSVDAPARISLRPLTLIYGKNSSGKSSILQSLLLLRQSVERGEIAPNGDLVNLGSFAGLVHGQDESRKVSIGLSFASHASLDSSLVVPDPRSVRSIDLTLSSAADGRTVEVDRAITGLGNNSFVWEAFDGDRTRFAMLPDDIGQLVDLAYSADSVFPARARSSGAQGRRVRSGLRSAGIDRVLTLRDGILPGGVAADTTEEIAHRTAGGSRSGLIEAALRTATSLTHSISIEAGNLLRRISYLGPLRQAPERMSARTMRPAGLDVPFFLLDNTSEREEASQHLQQLGVAYELDAILISDHSDRRILGDMAAVVLTDKRSGVRLSPADVGFGISQVLPIVVEMSARSGSIIVVEQPEIHLHPAMQADLADLAIESIREGGRANQLILETHSENFMLRVQRRIREGILDADQVAVIYVDQDLEGRAVVRELRMDTTGEFIDEWPNGFFVERFDELFGDLA